uniref:CSON002116 protein n=1 Tax=Culicoides sonorensis TaxID=179676 RepID=A0A336LRS1_CULSO
MSKIQEKIVFLLLITNLIESAVIAIKKNQNSELDSSNIPIHTLNCEEPTGFCYAIELKLNKTHQNFSPVSTIPAEKVKIIHLGGTPLIYRDSTTSVMHTLTSDLCHAFPHLKMIDAKYLKLTEIKEDALNDCTELESINLANNELNEIHENLFKFNKNLNKIRLEDNRLLKINLNLFGELRHLNELGFDGHLLNDFHVNKVRHRGIIKLVVRFSDLGSINLRELDEFGITQNFPHLSSFIPCFGIRDSYQVRFLEQTYEPFAKMYCFERPGNWDQDEEKIITTTEKISLIEHESAIQEIENNGID